MIIRATICTSIGPVTSRSNVMEPAWRPCCHRLQATLSRLALQLLAYRAAAHSKRPHHTMALPPLRSLLTSTLYRLSPRSSIATTTKNFLPRPLHFAESEAHQRSSPDSQTKILKTNISSIPSRQMLCLPTLCPGRKYIAKRNGVLNLNVILSGYYHPTPPFNFVSSI